MSELCIPPPCDPSLAAVQRPCSSLDGFENGSSQQKKKKKPVGVEISAPASAGCGPPQLTASEAKLGGYVSLTGPWMRGTRAGSRRGIEHVPVVAQLHEGT